MSSRSAPACLSFVLFKGHHKVAKQLAPDMGVRSFVYSWKIRRSPRADGVDGLSPGLICAAADPKKM